MKITFKGDYALKAVLDLSINAGRPEKIEDIARRQDIPLKFLEQILLALKKGGFVRSVRGRKGGYALARLPEKITMGEVIRYIEGPTEPISCIAKTGETHCNYAAQCVFRDVFLDIGKYINNKIDQLTFAKLKDLSAKKMAQKKGTLDYCI
ncbi:MAG: Rrf2 family transcriptional regulator [Candidatus Margulisiibacteriota bacterium]